LHAKVLAEDGDFAAAACRSVVGADARDNGLVVLVDGVVARLALLALQIHYNVADADTRWSDTLDLTIVLPDTLQAILAADGDFGVRVVDGHAEVLPAHGDLCAACGGAVARHHNVHVGGIVRKFGGGGRR
jgi:hypothetical protein